MYDYFVILGIEGIDVRCMTMEAFNSKIRKSFRRFVFKVHPDKFPEGSEDQRLASILIKEGKEAMDALTCPETLKQYAQKRAEIRVPVLFKGNFETSLVEICRRSGRFGLEKVEHSLASPIKPDNFSPINEDMEYAWYM